MDAGSDAAEAIASGEAPVEIDTVIVNGRLAIETGKDTGANSGMVLRHACAARPS